MTPTYPARACVSATGISADGVSKLRYAYWLERVAAAMAIVVLLPVLAAVALVIYALSGAGPLIRHTRVGWQGRPLRMLKFRTMWDQSAAPPRFQIVEEVSGAPPACKKERDSRVTSRFAFFCRRYSIDELPQLLHVALGEMSLVGPRPLTREELDEHYPDCLNEVLSIRPGITGLWQVMGRNDLNYSTRRRMDRLFVRRASLDLYVFVLARSVAAVLRGRGAC